MNNLNSVLIEGNLTRDPDLRKTKTMSFVVTFPIAVHRFFKNAKKERIEEVSYINIQTWGYLAEGCHKYLRKGQCVRVIGRFKQERWTDATGKLFERTVIIAEHVEFNPHARNDARKVEDNKDVIDLAGVSVNEAPGADPVALEAVKEINIAGEASPAAPGTDGSADENAEDEPMEAVAAAEVPVAGPEAFDAPRVF